MRIPDHRLDLGIQRKLEIFLAEKYSLSMQEARRMRVEHTYKCTDLKAFYYKVTCITPSEIIQCGIDFAAEEELDHKRSKGDPKFSRTLLYRLLEKKISKKADIDILLCLAFNQNKLGECFITAGWLSDMTGMSRTRVLKHLHFLEEKRIISIQRLRNYRYIVTIPDNTFEEHYRYQNLYADLRRRLFHQGFFKKLNGPAKMLLLAALSTEGIGEANRSMEKDTTQNGIRAYVYPMEYPHAKKIWTRYMSTYAFDSGMAELKAAGLMEKTSFGNLEKTVCALDLAVNRTGLTHYRHASEYSTVLIKIDRKNFQRIRHKDNFILMMHLTDIILRGQKIILGGEELVEATRAIIRGDSELRRIMERLKNDKKTVENGTDKKQENNKDCSEGIEPDSAGADSIETEVAKKRLFRVGDIMVFSEYRKGRCLRRRINHDQMLLSPCFVGKKMRLCLSILIREIKALFRDNSISGSTMIRKASDYALQTIYGMYKQDLLVGYCPK